MAIIATIETDHGESRTLYIRLNNFEQLANHGEPAIARFRGYVSREAFLAGKKFVWEQLVTFTADAPSDPWPLAYTALKSADLAAVPAAELEELDEAVAELDVKIAAAAAAVEAAPNDDDLKRSLAAVTARRDDIARHRPALVAAHEAAAALALALQGAASA